VQLLAFGARIGHQPRQHGIASAKRKGRSPRHQFGIGDRFGQIGEQLFHSAGLRQMMARVGAAALFRLDIGAIGDAQHHIMGFMAGRFEEARHIRGDQGQAAIIGEVEQRCFGTLFDGIAGAGDFDIEAVWKQWSQNIEGCGGLGTLAVGQQPGDRAVGRAGQRDETRGMAGERGEFGFSIEMRARDEVKQVAPSARVLDQKRQMVDRRGLPRPQRPGRQRPPVWQQHAENGLHAGIHARPRESHRCKQAAAIGQRDRRKTPRRCCLCQRLHLDRRVEHGKAGLRAQRNEHGRP